MAGMVDEHLIIMPDGTVKLGFAVSACFFFNM